MKRFPSLFAVAALILVSVAAIAQTAGIAWNVTRGNQYFPDKVWVGDTLAVEGVATLPEISEWTPTDSTASLTSPTKTINVSGKSVIFAATNVSQTGLLLTGGKKGKPVIVVGTDDSKTLRLDDGTSYVLTGNLTLGLGDTATLVCTTDEGDEWAELAHGAN